MQQRPRLISTYSLAGLVVAVGVVLVLLYPQQRLAVQIGQNAEVDEVSLQYIRNLLATDPDNTELRLNLAKAYAAIGQYEKAMAALQPLYVNADALWREKAVVLKLDILLKIAFAAISGSADREEKMAQFRRALRESEAQISHDEILRQFLRIAEAGGELQLAELVAVRLMNSSRKLTDLDEAARLALANGHYLISAQYTWRARQITPDFEQKVAYLNQAMSTLLAGGLGQTGLDWVEKLPAAEWQRADVLYSMTRLAMATKRPALAVDFALKLVGFDHSSRAATHFIAANFELAYAAFLGNQDLPDALRLAQIAVKQEPDNVVWRERLAHVAEWSNQPQLALLQWRWLAMHRGNESDWQAWMRLAAALFDYDAQIVGLERDWNRNGKDEKYARKIVQLYENLGRPEAALAWLDRNSDEITHPELSLLSAELLNNMGREAEARARYHSYLSSHVASPDHAVIIASLLQRNGQYQEAYKVLQRSRPQAKPEDKLFWINLGELAWMLKQYDEAEVAYRTLSDVTDAEQNQQVRLFQVLKYTDSKLAAQTAEKYWIKNGGIDLFLSAADTYASLNEWNAVQHMYKMAAAPTWRDYESSQRFVSLRAEMNKQTGNTRAAELDYRLLAMRYPEDLGIKEVYLWMLIEAHNFNQLDIVMQRWEKLLPEAPVLWDVFAAGHLALGRPAKALTLYDRMAKSHVQDELWLLNYAATLELCGQAKMAGQIRHQIWQKRLSKKTSHDWLNTRANASDIEALRLLLLNDPSVGQGILWKLLRNGSAELKQNSQFVELAALWLNEHDQNDAGRAWLIRQYAHTLNTPQ